jgi:HD-GYP domain-containing protein (c-di-GMP phosphodiesterase class II)
MEANLAIAQTLRYAEELRELHVAERTLRRTAERTLDDLERMYGATVKALASALELRDDQTGDHAERVAALAVRLTRKVAPELLADPQLEYGFLLHDLGKIGIPDAILLKPDRLTPTETKQMQYHPELGAQIVGAIPDLDGAAVDVIAAHHERWDGTGYPHGLKGDAIPLGARIFAVVDAWDAMTNHRPYRRALRRSVALARLRKAAGTQFEPRMVDAFTRLVLDERPEARDIACRRLSTARDTS